MGKINSRAKGQRAEREIVKIYEQAGHACHRTPLSGGGHEKGDIIGVPGLHIEAKHQEALNIWKALEQAENDAEPGNLPVVHFRRNRTKWYVALDLYDFMELLREARKIE